MVPRTTDRPPGLDLPDIYRWNFAQLPVMADDVAYIDEVLAALESQLCVDHNRVYATGASNGGPDVAGRPLRASSAALVGGGRRHLVLQAATFIAKRSAPSWDAPLSRLLRAWSYLAQRRLVYHAALVGATIRSPWAGSSTWMALSTSVPLVEFF